MREEELKWALRAKTLKVVHGDDNTQFFHMIANGKHRKKKIIQLEQDEETIVGHENLKLYISNFYKQLFGDPFENFVSLDEARVDDIPQLRNDENEILTAPFSEKEISDALFQIGPIKALGTDGFPARFYQRNWGVLKEDIIHAVKKFFDTGMMPEGVNDTVIVLVPKVKNPQSIKEFRPISLCNVIYKII